MSYTTELLVKLLDDNNQEPGTLEITTSVDISFLFKNLEKGIRLKHESGDFFEFLGVYNSESDKGIENNLINKTA